MVKHIAATGCDVLLVQKSILREALNDLAMDFLAKAKIMVIRDVERDDIDFISKVAKISIAQIKIVRRLWDASQLLLWTISRPSVSVLPRKWPRKSGETLGSSSSLA